MGSFVLPLLCLCCWPADGCARRAEGSYLYRPAYCLDEVLRGPPEPYVPQPGDIFLATDQALLMRLGHWAAGGAGGHHSGIVFARSARRLALLEGGPLNSI